MTVKHVGNIKAIVVDLDRTLLHTDKSISAYTLGVLKKCREKGIKIMVATARPLRASQQYCDEIAPDAVVVSNGARVICGDQRTDYAIGPKSAADLLNALGRYPSMRITLETGENAYSNLPVADYETVLIDDLVRVTREEAILKVLVHLDEADTLGLVARELGDALYYSISIGYLMQIMDTSATKWNGIQAMLKACGCEPAEAAYFGDDHDDVEPIKMCGLGIAVSNAIEEVKAAADFIAESNDVDGVARFIEQNLLND